MNALTLSDRDALETIVLELERAWNTCDAAGFAAPFAIDGDQVNIFGGQLTGRREIETRHERIFTSIFRGSTNRLEIVSARYAAPGVIVARVSSIVQVPQGPLQGELRTLASIVLRSLDGHLEIVSFHNTRVAD